MGKHKEVRRPASFLFGVIALSGSIGVFVLSNTFFKDWIIISIGIRAFQLIKIGEMVAIVVSTIFSGVSGIPLIVAMHTRKREQEQKLAQKEKKSRILADYAGDSTNPDFTRERLDQLWQEMPGLEDLVERCLGQMDRMDRLQDRQRVLIESNDARYLKDTVAVLDNVERRLCRNFQNIINLCIAADDIGHLDMKEIERNLSDNEKKLENTNELLKASAKRINQYNAGDDESIWNEVESWITTINESLKGD